MTNVPYFINKQYDWFVLLSILKNKLLMQTRDLFCNKEMTNI